jgi:hypothetical protein
VNFLTLYLFRREHRAFRECYLPTLAPLVETKLQRTSRDADHYELIILLLLLGTLSVWISCTLNRKLRVKFDGIHVQAWCIILYTYTKKCTIIICDYYFKIVLFFRYVSTVL